MGAVHSKGVPVSLQRHTCNKVGGLLSPQHFCGYNFNLVGLRMSNITYISVTYIEVSIEGLKNKLSYYMHLCQVHSDLLDRHVLMFSCVCSQSPCAQRAQGLG